MICTLYIHGMYIVHTWYVNCAYVFGLTSGAWHKVLSPQQNFADLVQNAMCLFKIPLGLFHCLIREVFLKDVKKINRFLLQFRHLWLWNAWLARRNIPIHAQNEYFYNLVTGISNVRQFVQTWAGWGSINSPIDENSLLYECLYITQPCIYHAHTSYNIPREQWGHEPRREE